MESGGLADEAGLPHDSYSTAGFDERIARCYYSENRYAFCCILMQRPSGGSILCAQNFYLQQRRKNPAEGYINRKEGI